MGKYDTWDAFFAGLPGDSHELGFDELEVVLGSALPESAYNHQSWWSNAQRHARWAGHGWSAHANLNRRRVRFTRGVPSRTSGPSDRVLGQGHRLILLGCVSEKRDAPAPARDLYISPLWSKRRAYAEATGEPWAILSAEHGLIMPDMELTPYDRSLSDEPLSFRREWSSRVAGEVAALCRKLGLTTVEAHAGAAYLESGLIQALNQQGIRVMWPVRALRIGEQLSWYEQHDKRQGQSQATLHPPEADFTDTTAAVELIEARRIGPFDWRWPDSIEAFEHGWEGTATSDGHRFGFRHGVGGRVVYGRYRTHTVTWVNGAPAVEGVGADDFEQSGSLLSLIKTPSGAMARTQSDIAPGYAHLTIVDHRAEINAPYSRAGLAVKIGVDDVSGWLLHAVLRRGRPAAARNVSARTRSEGEASPESLESMPPEHKTTVAAALAAFAPRAVELAADLSGNSFAANPEANRLLEDDPFALLIAVISDYQVPAERAWLLPYLLKERLGHLDPMRMVADPEAVVEAVARRPSLHRYTANVPAFIVDAARVVLDEYDGDAGSIWEDEPTAVDLQRRLAEFKGISQKKAAMAVEILERDFGVPIREMDGSDVAFDVHLRRVFLRTGLAELDDQDHMAQAARTWWPERPGVLDLPAWVIGRTWCRPTAPDCPECPIGSVCAKRVEAAGGVRGA